MTKEKRPSKSSEDAGKIVEALVWGLDVLCCFHHGDRYLGDQEISKRTRLPKSTVSWLTLTLAELGYLNYSKANNKYCLGNAVIVFGLRQTHTDGYSPNFTATNASAGRAHSGFG